MIGNYVYQRELLEALWLIDNYDREIESVQIGKGDGIIRFCDGEEMTIKYGVKRYKAEILGEYYAEDPETYPDFVHQAFEYYDLKCKENPDRNRWEIAEIAARSFNVEKNAHDFILDCFRVNYPEFA